MPRVAVLVVTDGRPYLSDTLRSAEEYLFPYITGPVLVASDVNHRLGLSGNVRQGWRMVGGVHAEYVFHLEDDFVFTGPVPVDQMVELLETERLAQVALKRQPVNPVEQALGGFMEANPHNYSQRQGWVRSEFGFTLNPCLYRNPKAESWIWPEGGGEAEFTAWLRRHNPSARFGIYGNVDDPPR